MTLNQAISLFDLFSDQQKRRGCQSISLSDAPQRTNTHVFSEIVAISYTISYTKWMRQSTKAHEQPRTGSSGCHLVFHPLDDLLLIPDDRARTQLDLLGEGSVPHAVIDEGLAHPRHLKDL